MGSKCPPRHKAPHPRLQTPLPSLSKRTTKITKPREWSMEMSWRSSLPSFPRQRLVNDFQIICDKNNLNMVDNIKSWVDITCCFLHAIFGNILISLSDTLHWKISVCSTLFQLGWRPFPNYGEFSDQWGASNRNDSANERLRSVWTVWKLAPTSVNAQNCSDDFVTTIFWTQQHLLHMTV